MRIQNTSVADPGCLSRILIFTHPGSKNSNKREGWKKISFNFLCSHKFLKIANYLSFEVLQKKIWANFQRIIELFTQKIVTKLSKIWIWDPGSGKNLFRIPRPKRHRIPDPDPQHWKLWPPDPQYDGPWINLEPVFCSDADPDPGSDAFLTSGSGIGFFRIPNPYFWELSDNFLGEKFYNSSKIGPNFFLQHFNTQIICNFEKFVAT
jgi:hypothetical protein